MTKTFCDLCDRGIETKKYILPSYDKKVAYNKDVPIAYFVVPTDIEMDICIYCQDKIRGFLQCTNFKEDKK